MYHWIENIKISQQLIYMLFCRRFQPLLAEKIVLFCFTPPLSHLSHHKAFSPQKFSVEQFVWKFGPPKEITAYSTYQKMCYNFPGIKIVSLYHEMSLGSVYHTHHRKIHVH